MFISVALEVERERLIVQKHQINRQIKAPKVLLIDHENTNHGLTDTLEALRLAEEAQLDLVLVSESKQAPVAKILDYGKFQYQQKKRQKQSARTTVKEVKLRPNVGESDYQLRINQAVQWLGKGDSVKFRVRLRGREHQHRERAIELLERIEQDLKETAKIQSFDRRALVLQLMPA
ncbi:translation initiation factor IF-3 [Leptothoe sp. PORK10 BA2]|uniref:translation initiation factor IF-3 n=1 Tax=Leptothoe sp. PORK10 BA2 TaxID=3110254 RepID=UPI002B20211D|nr:translation initiation factor IF-3 [Leptothoe sp. PORK10 BA2]MEA5464396.1 translation initiation factor IF-3 [Leptothoe sp. PORK10 BA2]